MKYQKLASSLDFCLCESLTSQVHCFGLLMNLLVEIRCLMLCDHKQEPVSCHHLVHHNIFGSETTFMGSVWLPCCWEACESRVQPGKEFAILDDSRRSLQIEYKLYLAADQSQSLIEYKLYLAADQSQSLVRGGPLWYSWWYT